MNDDMNPMPLDVFPSCGRIAAGEQGDAAGAVQMMLNALLVRYDGWEFLAPTFALDEPTTAAVRAFRAIHAMEDSPGVDVATWNELASEYAILREAE